MSPNSITTRKGDEGRTSLATGERVFKDTPHVEAGGEVDELMSALGLARSHACMKETAEMVLKLQKRLVHVASELASNPGHLHNRAQPITGTEVEDMTERCAELEQRLKIEAGFVTPGDSKGGAFLHLARTFARRCERTIVHLHREGEMDNEALLGWINRLSDYLWLLARLEDQSCERKL